MCEPIDDKLCVCDYGGRIVCLCGICQVCHRKVKEFRRGDVDSLFKKVVPIVEDDILRVSDKGKAYHKAYHKAYRQSDKGKAYHKAYQKAFRQSDKGKAYQKAYYQRRKSVSEVRRGMNDGE